MSARPVAAVAHRCAQRCGAVRVLTSIVSRCLEGRVRGTYHQFGRVRASCPSRGDGLDPSGRDPTWGAEVWVSTSRVHGVTTALYRRYRPETFAEVVGQDHVTGPLRQALRSGQTNHAYLFSGPRGCGKTTSARILARCLNCEQGPTDTPCGTCPSCVELARGGPGSLDVVEIDAASHGGVDDARDLRERATFAPARDRYKVFILDEAHMVSPQGFNALLKIVEEPPEHVKFIFATTEPDKVIGTIRSRTHHYPFRLVPPDVLTGYLEELCTSEGVTVGSGVLPLVVRAGAGSVRDSLSVLDQLIAGSGPEGLDYEGAVALLGYTHASLLDDLVEAVAARDGASAFRVVERVISTGHEPRRFVEDLLERLRDLIVLAASGDAAAAVLRDVPADQLTRMRTQAGHLGAAELSRSADLVNAALSEMTGATSPRLHLELLMARLLLPGVDDTATGLGARIDRLERQGVGVGAVATVRPASAPPVLSPVEPAAAVAAPAPPSAADDERADVVPPSAPVVPDPVPAPLAPDLAAETATPVDAAPISASDADQTPTDESRQGAAPAESFDGGGPRGASSAEPVRDATAPDRAATAAPASAPGPETVVVAAPAPAAVGRAGSADTEMLRQRWPEVLDTLGRLKKTTWVLISQNAQVIDLDATTLRLGFSAPGLATAFRGGSHADVVQRAVRETLGFDVRVEPVLADGTGGTPRPQGGPASSPPGRPGESARGDLAAPDVAGARTGGDGASAGQAGSTVPAGREPGGREASERVDESGTPADADPEPAPEPSLRDAPDATTDDATADVAATADDDAADVGALADAAVDIDAAGDVDLVPSGPTTSADGWPVVAAPGGSTSAAMSAPTVDGPAAGGATEARSTAEPASDDDPSGSSMAASGRPAPAVAPSARRVTAVVEAPAVVAEPAPPWDVPGAAPTGHPDDPGLEEPPDDDPGESPVYGSGQRSAAPSAPRQGAQPATSPAPSVPAGPGGAHAAAIQAARAAATRSSAVRSASSSGAGNGWDGAGGQNGPAGASAASRYADDEPSPDDPDITSSGLSGAPLVAQMLGGTVIDEQIDDAF